MTQISTANLQWFCSGAGSNANPLLCLGGAISSAQWATTTALDDLFPDITGAQAAAGVVQYLCLYFKNVDTNVNGLLSPAVYFLSQVTPTDANDKIAAAIASTEAKNATAQTIATITTAPSLGTNSWVDASSALTYAAALAGGLALPTPMLHNDYQAVWFKRTIGAGAAASGAVSTITSFSGNGTTVTLTCSGGCVTATGDTITVAGTSASSIDGTYQVTGGNGTTTVTIASTVVASTITSATITRPSGTWIAVGGDTTA